MRRESDATALLNRLLDRHERSSGARKIAERPAQSFGEPADLRSLIETLSEAADAGAVTIVWDRDAPHLVGQVVLSSADRLYAFTGRRPSAELARDAIRGLRAETPATDPARGLLDDLIDSWSRGSRLLGLGTANLDEARQLVRAMDAAFTEMPADVPLRTRSARLLGDSKALERALPSILAHLRNLGVLDPGLPRQEALDRLGLAKFALPALVAGPLEIGGSDVSAWPYVGVAPELVGAARLLRPCRTILTVENLESFNRHVRSSRFCDDVVVYTGGFPSSNVLAIVRAILATGSAVLHHWGDVDPGGLRIGRHLETALSVRVVPHLMDVARVARLGGPPDVQQAAPSIPAGSAFFELSRYLAGPEARWLEQEVVDPEIVPQARDPAGRG